MTFRETPLPGAFLIEVEPFSDERGLFARTYDRDEFESRGLNPEIAQVSTSYNRRRGTLRGLHFQLPPHEEAKLVRVTSGAVYDVLLDLRPESETYLRWWAAELSVENRHMVYIPEGLAHGFLTLTDDTEIHYQISTPFTAEAYAGVRYDDPAFGIVWPDVGELIISEKDRTLPDFETSPQLTALRR
jgi:dTDP-4-dehydrorhamnose 3,5-epimerase